MCWPWGGLGLHCCSCCFELSAEEEFRSNLWVLQECLLHAGAGSHPAGQELQELLWCLCKPRGHWEKWVRGINSTESWGWEKGHGMCVAGVGTEAGRMWRFWCAAHTQEVWPPWLQTYVYLEMYSEISASFLIWFAFIWGEQSHQSRGVGGFVWVPSQQRLKVIYSWHLAVLVVTRRRHVKVGGHVLPRGTEEAGFAFVQLQRGMSSPIQLQRWLKMPRHNLQLFSVNHVQNLKHKVLFVRVKRMKFAVLWLGGVRSELNKTKPWKQQ